jgi:hypothetical protein
LSVEVTKRGRPPTTFSLDQFYRDHGGTPRIDLIRHRHWMANEHWEVWEHFQGPVFADLVVDWWDVRNRVFGIDKDEDPGQPQPLGAELRSHLVPLLAR